MRLAVPDRRFTFDILRNEARLSDVQAAYLVRARVPQPHLVLDYLANTKRLDIETAWRGNVDAARLEPCYSLEQSIDETPEVVETSAYRDVHCWVFTPRSFGVLFGELAAIGLLNFACESRTLVCQGFRI